MICYFISDSMSRVIGFCGSFRFNIQNHGVLYFCTRIGIA